MLSQTIESLIGRTVKLQVPGQSLTLPLGHLGRIGTYLPGRYEEGLEGLAVRRFPQELFAMAVIEGDASRGFVYTCLHRPGLDRHLPAVGHRKPGLSSLADNRQALLVRQLSLRGGLHTDDIVADDLQTDNLRTASGCLADRNGYILPPNRIVRGPQSQRGHTAQCRNKQSQASHGFTLAEVSRMTNCWGTISLYTIESPLMLRNSSSQAFTPIL